MDTQSPPLPDQLDAMLDPNVKLAAAAASSVRIQARPETAPMGQSPAVATPSAPQPPTQRAKRQQIAVACARCRSRKSKCDGARPSCSSCKQRGCDCHYDVEADATRAMAQKRRQEAMQKKLDQYQEVYQYLRDRPEQEAFEILHRIRQGWDVIALHAYIKEGELLLPPNMRNHSSGSVDSDQPSPQLDGEPPV